MRQYIENIYFTDRYYYKKTKDLLIIRSLIILFINPKQQIFPQELLI